MLMTMTPFPQLVMYVGVHASAFSLRWASHRYSYFRRQPGWRKLGPVSFAWPLVPILFLIPEVWIVIWGVQLKPYISLATVITMATGALVYHFRIRPKARVGDSGIETY